MKLSPVCSSGTPLKLAVSAADGGPPPLADGPFTVADGLLVSALGVSSRVQTAPVVPQARPPASVIVTFSAPDGSTVISHRSWRPPTRGAPVTAPPVVVKDSSRSVW